MKEPHLLTITRLQARRIRSVFRRALGLRQKSHSVPVVLTGIRDQLQVQAATEFLIASVTFAGQQPAETIAVPWELLRDCEGRHDDRVAIERIPDGRISASFQDHGVPVIKWYDQLEASVAVEGFPTPVEECRENSIELLTALQHASEITSDSPTRYALDHLRLRGSDGSISSTDGRHLLHQTGFDFLWQEDVLVPGMPVFGHSELRGHKFIAIGKQADWVTLMIGPWTFGLRINKEGRFPNIEDNLRRPDTALASLSIVEPDAKFLAEVLPRHPSHNPITLELNGSIAFRARPAEEGQPTEVVLRQSHWSGADVRLNTDRRFLANALRFGLRELSSFKPDVPLLCHDLRRSYVWMPLAADQAIPPTADCVRIESPGGNQAVAPIISKRMRKTMSTTSPTAAAVSRNHTNGHAQPTESRDNQSTNDSRNAIDQASLLRETLHSAAQQAGALVRELKWIGGGPRHPARRCLACDSCKRSMPDGRTWPHRRRSPAINRKESTFMPMKLNVGISKKIGQPDYGSLGASCNVEVELESSLLHQDLEGFHRHVKNAFIACRQAVHDELNRAQQSCDVSAEAKANGRANGHGHGHHSSNGNGGQTRSHGRKATSSQVRAIYAIADRQGIELGELLRSRYSVDQSDELTISEASQLIDELKGAASGAGGGR